MGLTGTLLPLGIILCAWGIKASCDKLMTGQFIASILSDVVAPLWFPALVFIVASLISFATGTSWGTMAILIPTAIPVAFLLDDNTYGITTIICLGAVLDGAIFGDHCSPISDTTILSAIVSSCDPMHHVRTQMPYALTVAIIALMCGYLPAASSLPSWIGILCGGGCNNPIVCVSVKIEAGLRRLEEKGRRVEEGLEGWKVGRKGWKGGRGDGWLEEGMEGWKR